MSSVQTSIDSLIRENKIFRFTTELENTNMNRKVQLQKIINNFTNPSQDNEVKAKETLLNMKEQFNKIQMKKKWRLLNEEQQKEQLVIYCDKYPKHKDKIFQMFDTKKLKQKNVIYNIDDGFIEDILFESKK